MKKTGFVFVLGAVCLLGMVACSDGSDCYSDNTSTITLEFYRLNDTDPDTSFYEKDTVVFGEVYSLGKPDSLLVKEDSAYFSPLVLPVDPTIDTTAFVIGEHALVVTYDIRQRIMSPDCGVEQVFSSLDTLSSTFDSLAIKSRNLDRNEINFQIYSN